MAPTIQNHKKKTGRPKGSSTSFPGIIALASQVQRNPDYLRCVFRGKYPLSPTLAEAIRHTGHALAQQLPE